MVWWKLLLLVAVISLSGCATTNSNTAIADRLHPVRIEPGVYRIGVIAGNFTSYSSVESALLLKSAELALADGYERFILIPDDEGTRAAEASGSVRSMARRGKWGGREGVATVQVTHMTNYVGGLYLNGKMTKGSVVTVLFKTGEKRVSPGINAKETVTRLRPR